MKKIFLHVGQYKTGTTALQKYLLNSMEYLETHGIFFCSAYRYFKSSNYSVPNGSLFFGLNFLDKKLGWIDYKSDDIDFIYKKTLQDIESTSCPNVLISTEHLFDTSTENLEKLRDSLISISDDLYVVLYLRDLLPYINSSYIQRITAGDKEIRPFQTFFESLIDKPELQYDYYKNLKRYETVFSKGKLIIKHFGPNLYGKNITKDFFQILGKEVVKTVGNENRNVTAAAAECFRKFRIEYSKTKSPDKIMIFMGKNVEKFQFGAKDFMGISSAKLIEKRFKEDHKKITDEYGIPLSFKHDNHQTSDLKISIEDTNQFVRTIKHLL